MKTISHIPKGHLQMASSKAGVTRALIVCTFLMLGGQQALAGKELSALLQILRDNGTITEEQYQQLVAAAEVSSEKSATPATTAPPPADSDAPSNRHDCDSAVVETDGGLKVESADGDFSFELEGQVWFDAAHYRIDRSDLGSGTNMRRARVSLSGTLYEHWAFAAEYDFAGNEAEVKDAFIA